MIAATGLAGAAGADRDAWSREDVIDPEQGRPPPPVRRPCPPPPAEAKGAGIAPSRPHERVETAVLASGVEVAYHHDG
jgi:hypothetical protein